MFKNYIIVTTRNLLRNKVNSLINVGGLAIGIACCILIFLYMKDELTYDTFHEKADTIFAIRFKSMYGTVTYVEGPLGPALKSEYPEVTSFIRVFLGESLIRYKEKIFNEKIMYSDPNFFTFFTFPLEIGSPEKVLQDPNSIVITRQMAEKYFSGEDPIGKIISLNLDEKYEDYVVTGVAKCAPSNSSIQFDFVINVSKWRFFNPTKWDRICIETFIRLTSNNKKIDLNKKLSTFVKKYVGSKYQDKSYNLFLTSFVDHHLNINSSGIVLEKPSNPVNSYILSGIALLVLLVGCFNFITLTIGNSSTRIKEIGMRKVLGAYREQIAKQFWFESLFLCFIALIVGIALAELFLPTFNALSGKTLSIDYSRNLMTLIFLITLGLSIAIVSGSYPAVIFSGFNEIDILRSKLKIGKRNLLTRSLLVVQFAISIFLLITIIIMKQQQTFATNIDLGFDKNNIVVIPLFSSYSKVRKSETSVNSFKSELSQYNNIISVSASSGTLGTGTNGGRLSGIRFKDKGGNDVDMVYSRVDSEFVRTLGIEIIQGKNFSPDDASNSIIVNQSFLKRLSISNPIGKVLTDVEHFVFKNSVIIGVVKDFHDLSLKYVIDPVFLTINPKVPFRYLNIKMHSAHISETIAIMKDQFQKYFSDQPFSYTFLDDDIAKQYEQEVRWSKIVTITSIFAILIACSGLFGLTLLTVVRRTKEIGIRKALGSSVSDIVYLLAKEFSLLIILSNIIAWPIAYYAMNRWLQTFAYRIHLTPLPFLLVGIIALIIALGTVSFQAIKAARANPVEALRYE